MTLLVAPCTHQAARHAVESWHYSRRMPASKLVRFGVWEAGRFVGAVIYGRGATPNIGKPYDLDMTQVCALVRVALREHDAPVTQIMAETRRLLRDQSPGLRLLVSFADSDQGHHGGIYQADNWLYLGPAPTHRFRVNGELVHPRVLGLRYGVGGQSIPWLRRHVDPNADVVHMPPKHRYVYPLDRGMRRRLLPQSQPYPTRAGEGSTVSRAASSGEVQVQPLPPAPTQAA